MTFKDAESLKAGDQVYWADPDDDACSRVITIDYIEVKGDFVCIVEGDGSVVEAFPHELSYAN